MTELASVETDLPHRAESRTIKWMDGIKRTDAGRSLMPMEASVAWPIPFQQNNKVYAVLPFYLRLPSTSDKYAMFPWLGGFTMDWASGRVVEYVDYRFRSPWATLDFSKPFGAADRPSDAVIATAKTLAPMYDELLDTMTQKGTLPPFWVASFRAHLARVIEPPQLEFYRKLAPKFSERFLA
jgi:hypothetical protein